MPHLVPMIRGMLSTIYVDLTEQGQQKDLQALYEDFYKDERFVDVMPANSSPETRSVRGANELKLHYTVLNQVNSLSWLHKII